jgi:ABC-2 type transport system ATP-binding protein
VTTPAVELQGVSKVFRDFWYRQRVRAVEDLTLSIDRGEALGLVGPNGSGKSTTIKLILGLLFPSGGKIRVMGWEPQNRLLKERVGYLPEDSVFYRFLNAVETLDFYGRLFSLTRTERKNRAHALIEMVGLEGAQARPVAEYSKGMQRRLGLAQALINDPDFLILDEPTAGMDPLAARQIKDLVLDLRGRGKTILLCTHLLAEVEDVCSRLAILYGGRLLREGSVDSLLTETKQQKLTVPALNEETLGRIDSVVRAAEGDGVVAVENPRKRLEDLFLEVVDGAEGAGLRTSGASSGAGATAEFLRREGIADAPPLPNQDSSADGGEE